MCSRGDGVGHCYPLAPETPRLAAQASPGLSLKPCSHPHVVLGALPPPLGQSA